MPITWEDLSKKIYPRTQFILDPYIPQGGIVLLYGRTSVGKSPLTWEMARAIGAGTSFYGLPTLASRVLYIEVDTPEQSIAQRIQKLPPVPNVWWEFLQPLSIPNVTREQEAALIGAREASTPDVVFINTLRKVHDLDDKDSRAPKLVYSFFQRMFPSAALVFVHHMRKRSQDPNSVTLEEEGFSGSQAWMNDCQVGIHLEPFKGADGRENLRLYHRKSQVTAPLRPLPLFLDEEANLRSPLYDELLSTYNFLNEDGEHPPGVLDALLAERLGCSISTAKKRRLDIECRRFPGSRHFLS